MSASPFRTFHYHANAHVLSANFTRPLQHLVEVQGASSLPTIGGHGRALVEDFRFNEFLSVKRGYTHVSGSSVDVEGKKHFTTLVTAVAEGVNILDVFHAELIVARFASSHTVDEAEGHFSLVGTKFDGVQIGGCKTEVPIDTALFERLDTFAAARNEFKSNADFRRMAEDPFEAGGQKLGEQPPHGAILCSIVDLKNMKSECPGVVRRGHGFVIPKFGKLFLGEILLEHGQRTLTMVRFELGSPVAGSGTVVALNGNGSPIPPPPLSTN